MLGFIIAMAAATPVVATDDPDSVVRCVRESITGSLSTTRRVCHTVGEWRRIRSDANDEARRNAVPGTLNDLNNDPKGG